MQSGSGASHGSVTTSPPSGTAPRPPAPPRPSDDTDNASKCPFCGGRADTKRPKLDVIKKVGGSAYDFGGFLETRRPKDSYYKCNGCTMEFVYAEREIESILAGLEVGSKIAGRIKRYYKVDIAAVDLLKNHRTAIVRKVNNHLSFISAHVVKDELIICFCYNQIRTCGTFVKKSRKPVNGDYYLFDKLNKA